MDIFTISHRKCIVPSFVAGVHQVLDVIEIGHGQFGQVLHIRPQDGMLSDSQSPLRLWVEQIPNPLTVDLHVRHLEVGVRRDREKGRRLSQSKITIIMA